MRMISILWPLAVVLVAVLAWDVARRHIRTREQWNEARITSVEARLEALRDTGKVLAVHARKLATIERNLMGAPSGGEG